MSDFLESIIPSKHIEGDIQAFSVFVSGMTSWDGYTAMLLEVRGGWNYIALFPSV